MSIPSIFAAVATTAALFAATAPVRAAAFETPAMSVSYADLDMSTAVGQDRFDSRIRHAAGLVCGVPGSDLVSQRGHLACRTVAVADARAQMADVIAARTPAGGSLVVAAR